MHAGSGIKAGKRLKMLVETIPRRVGGGFGLVGACTKVMSKDNVN
ncbi:hypothetical protein [Paenibacillus timonensis]